MRWREAQQRAIHFQQALFAQSRDARLQADAVLFFDAGEINACELAQAQK